MKGHTVARDTELNKALHIGYHGHVRGVPTAWVGAHCRRWECGHAMSAHEMPAHIDLNPEALREDTRCGAEATDYQGKSLGRPCECAYYRP